MTVVIYHAFNTAMESFKTEVRNHEWSSSHCILQGKKTAYPYISSVPNSLFLTAASLPTVKGLA